MKRGCLWLHTARPSDVMLVASSLCGPETHEGVSTRVLKRAAGLVFCLAICAAGIWRQMQALAIVALIGCLAILFETSARRLAEVCLRLLENARQAKFGDLEVHLATLPDVSKMFGDIPNWASVLLHGLTPSQLGLLIAVTQVAHYPVAPALLADMAVLRRRGLVQHDAPALSGSKVLSATPLAQELVGALSVKRTVARPDADGTRVSTADFSD